MSFSEQVEYSTLEIFINQNIIIMNKNTLLILIFPLVLVGLLAIIPIPKLEAMGDFFYKIISPIGLPIGIVITTKYIFSRNRKDTS
jgi:cytochrome c biogenesis factor